MHGILKFKCESKMHPSSMTKKIYYLPGHGGQLTTGLGAALLSRGFEVDGRETRGDFNKLGFMDQAQLIAEDLTRDFSGPDDLVIANSYGAYLFLHAQSLIPALKGKVILLSPIVGEFSDDNNTGLAFIPPYAERLFDLAQRGELFAPAHCEIHVGENDWQSRPDNVKRLGGLLGVRVFVVPEAGHMLPKPYVADLLDRWLA
jgi:hypothetical protein